MTHKNGNHSHTKHWTFVCADLQPHEMQILGTVYQDTEAPGAWTVS